MQFVADLHLHSKYSRAVSQQMVLPVMDEYARRKGLDILSTGDFTHPVWFKEIRSLLEEEGEGIYKLKVESSKFKVGNEENEKRTLFILTTEIASIYKQGDKVRRIHNLVFAPNVEAVEKIRAALLKRGANLSSDGRPIIGLTSKDLLTLILEADERCMLIPCHIWTPHFGVLGSASGFDSLAEAYGDMAQYVYGIETGLSSDPDMNWSIAELKNRSIISNSDAHSPGKMGREATVFELKEATYENIRKAIMKPMIKSTIGKKVSEVSNVLKVSKGNSSLASDTSGTSDTLDTFKIAYTIEFYPEEGRYHFSGHRNCLVSYGPEEIREKGTVCPTCRRKMTEGVVLRVEQLSNPALRNRAEVKLNEQGLAWHTDNLHLQPSYVKLVPLIEIIAETLESTTASKKTQQVYLDLTDKFKSEIDILLRTSLKDLEAAGGVRLSQGIAKVRKGDINIKPGYDGEYGRVKIWGDKEQTEETQMSIGF